MGNPNAFKTSKRIVGGFLALAALGASGFVVTANSEPQQPNPQFGEQPEATWSGRPLIPAVLNNILSTHLPNGHENDLSATVKVYHDSTIGNYAVMAFNTVGQDSLSTTMTCKPDKSIDVAYDPSNIHIHGYAFFVKHFNLQSSVATQTCASGEISATYIKSFVNPAP